MHYYAVLCLVPFVVWEVSNWRPWHLPSPKMMGGLLGMLCAVALLWMPLQGGRGMYPPNYWTRPSPDLLREIFPGLFPDGLFLLAVVVVWIALVGKDRVIPLQPMQSGERIGSFFFLIPLAGYLLGEISHVFGLRYFIGTLPGIAVAFSCCLWRHFHRAWRVSLGVFLILASWGVAKQVTAARDPNRFYYSPIRQILSMENPLRNDGKQFFAVCNQARYLEALHYSKHPEEYVLLASLDAGNLNEITTLAHYYPMRFWTLGDLKKHARETALIAPLPGNLDTLKTAAMESRHSSSIRRSLFIWERRSRCCCPFEWRWARMCGWCWCSQASVFSTYAGSFSTRALRSWGRWFTSSTRITCLRCMRAAR